VTRRIEVRAWRPGGGSIGFQFYTSPTIKALLAANITVFIIQYLVSRGASGGTVFLQTFGLVPAKVIPEFHIWQFGTYMFLHGNLIHLLFNMFAVWMFGSDIERAWGRRIFLSYYFVTGIGGGLIYTVFSWGSPIPLVGASGAVFGILLAYAILFPDRRIFLYFLIPIKAKYFVLMYGILELLAAAQPQMDGIGHFAHLGGMLFGYLFLKSGGVRLPKSSWNLDDLKGAWRRQRTKSKMRVIRPEDRTQNKRNDKKRINEILEKISREGLDSLTEEEQEILRRASRKH
jgi:membrane associated rhomboid family serine protease